MTKQEIRELRDKVGTDPILTDEEIEYIWEAIDKQYPIKAFNKAFKEGLTRNIFCCGDCGKCVVMLDEYCWFCGKKLDWED